MNAQHAGAAAVTEFGNRCKAGDFARAEAIRNVALDSLDAYLDRIAAMYLRLEADKRDGSR